MNISLTSVETALRSEDVEGYIEIHGAPGNEYDSEAKAISRALGSLGKGKLTEDNIVAVISFTWEKYFNLDSTDIEKRIPAFHRIARILMTAR